LGSAAVRSNVTAAPVTFASPHEYAYSGETVGDVTSAIENDRFFATSTVDPLPLEISWTLSQAEIAMAIPQARVKRADVRMSLSLLHKLRRVALE
jgi:hypothetical protein